MEKNDFNKFLLLMIGIIVLGILLRGNNGTFNFYQLTHYVDEQYIDLSFENDKAIIRFNYQPSKILHLDDNEHKYFYYVIPRYQYFTHITKEECDKIYGIFQKSRKYHNKCWISDNTYTNTSEKITTLQIHIIPNVNHVICKSHGFKKIRNAGWSIEIECYKDPEYLKEHKDFHWVRLSLKPSIYGKIIIQPKPETTTTTTTSTTISPTTTVNTTTTTYVTTTVIQCTKDSDCPEGYICKDNVCVEGIRPPNYTLYIGIGVIIFILFVILIRIEKEKYTHSYR